MKKRKIGGRILSAVIASAMLLSSMTVFAAKPTLPENLTDDQDGWDALDVYDEGLWEGENHVIETESLDAIKKYFGSDVLLIPADQYEAVETERNKGDSADFNALYNAYKALDSALVTGDGSYCVDNSLLENETATWDEINLIWKKVDNGSIIVVDTDNGEIPPDVSTLEKGTYWVTQSDLNQFDSDVATAENSVASYKEGEGDEKDWKKFAITCGTGTDTYIYDVIDISNETYKNYVESLMNAYSTLLDALHEGTKETATPVESLKTVSKSSSSSKSSSKQEEEPAPALVNEVLYSTGAKKQSSIEGVYGQTFVAGTIFNDEQAKIKQAAALSEEEIKSGVVIKYYICNSLNKKMNEKLSSVVTGQGYKVLGVMNCDLYKLEKGNITKIKTTGEALTVTIGVPEKLRNDKYEFVVMCYDESGNLVTMQDLDTDKNTITVQANSFGYWAIGYKTK